MNFSDHPEEGPLTQLIRTVHASDVLRPVPFFETWRSAGERGHRKLIATWIVVCVLVVPTGMLTRVLELTGIPIQLGGVDMFLTVYLPMVICIPLTLWLGYLWGAIPAYISTFLVALLGGMPLAWILLFSFANPAGLGVLYLGYNAFPIRTDLRSALALLYYSLLLFVASLVSSSGSLVWAHTNSVGLNQFYPAWQGWWLGGFVQGLVLVAPLLAVAGPGVERWKTRLGAHMQIRSQSNRRLLLVGGTMAIITVVGYVLVVQRFMLSELDRTVDASPALRAVHPELSNIFAGLILPQWVLVSLVAVTLTFGFRIGLLWSAQYRELASELEIANSQLLKLTVTDPLTGAANRSHLDKILPGLVSAAARHEQALSCLMIDIDNFKRINDKHGHLVGDDALRQVVKIISNRLRAEDFLCRFGGEEFVLVLPQTDTDGAVKLAEEVRRRVATYDFKFSGVVTKLTISIGVAGLSQVPSSSDLNRGLIGLADQALYRAKSQGRDRTVVALDPS